MVATVVEERIQASLLGVMIGDALGQPVETMTQEEILTETGGKEVLTFIDPIQTKITHPRPLKAGDYTDDWQLTKVVVESLIAKRGYDQRDMADRHIEAFKTSQIGWGGTTRKGIKELKEYQESFGVRGRRPVDAPWHIAGKGAGNGVAMKVAPLALFEACQDRISFERLFNEVVLLGRLTHPDPQASYTAYALALMIMIMVEPGHSTSNRRILLRTVIDGLKDVDRDPDNDLGSAEPTIQQLHKLEPLIGDAELIRLEITPGFMAIQSVIYAIGIFLTYPTDFRKAVLTAVNAGLDSDSTASMVGALVGANCGLDAIPKEWRTFRPHFQEPIELGSQLYRAANS